MTSTSYTSLCRGLVLVVGTMTALIKPTMAQAVPPIEPETGIQASLFDMSQVKLTNSRWLSNQDRTLTYLKSVDPDRLLYVFRNNHGLSTEGSEPCGGWDAPDFPFRSHMQGHVLTAWSQCWSNLQDPECRDRAIYFVNELAQCQANNEAAGFNPGYLSGFPESEIDKVENRTLDNGNVPYYAIHKTLVGLLDVWRHIGEGNGETPTTTAAKNTLISLAEWVHSRMESLTYAQTQAMLQTEFGGMSDVLTEIYHWTGDTRFLETAALFDHALVLDPLAAGRDELSGLHANTQVPKWIGAIRQYKATGQQRYLDIARNAWEMTARHHSYAIGGNSQAEHFRDPDAIAGFLEEDTCEACNSYNMLKLTRELWTVSPDDDDSTAGAETALFDFYERAMLNHLLGQQHPGSNHGHVTYFTPLNPGGIRGVGPAWGGGTWSTDCTLFCFSFFFFSEIVFLRKSQNLPN